MQAEADRIAAIWLNPGIAETEIRAGRAQPLPEYLEWFALVREFPGIRLCEAETLETMPRYLIEAKQIELMARDIVQTAMEAKHRH